MPDSMIAEVMKSSNVLHLVRGGYPKEPLDSQGAFYCKSFAVTIFSGIDNIRRLVGVSKMAQATS